MNNNINSLQSKNDYIIYRAIYNEELHHAIMNKDVEKIEVILEQFNKDHLKYYDFSLYDSNTKICIEYIKAEHEKELMEGLNYGI